MNILVANLGSTSFKYRLFAMSEGDARMLAKGGYERVTNYGEAIESCLTDLREQGALSAESDLDAVGFKTVLGRDLSGCRIADETVLTALEGFADVAPAHNPAYAAGIRQFAQRLPRVPRVALFETAFYQWVPDSFAQYAVPESWQEAGVRRYGFHGASHKFITERAAERLGREDVANVTRNLYLDGPQPINGAPCRVISCHLGGSSSITATQNGVAIGNSMGLSPQSGLPQNNRVGELDSMAIPFAVKQLGISVEEAERQLAKESGLLGISGVSNDLRDIQAAADQGNARAKLAIEHLVRMIRHWVGAFFFEMGGAEAIVFTGGIGENQASIRAEVCAGLQELGIVIDATANGKKLDGEADLTGSSSRTRILVIPTNEELVVARETYRLLASGVSVSNG